MTSQIPNEDNAKEAMKALGGMLRHFYYEGDTVWSKEVVSKVVLSRVPASSLDEPLIRLFFAEWEQKGFIKMIGKDDRYLEVLEPELLFEWARG